MLNFLRDLFRMMRGADLRSGCRHDWDEYSFGRRQCRKCQEHQLLMENRFPDVGEAKYEWR